MEEKTRLYWEAVKENTSNELIIHTGFNPLREFEEEFIDGPILEIGCGQSHLLLEYSNSGREIFAIDNEQFQLDALKDRISNFSAESKVNYINSTFLTDPLPKEVFSVIILSNLMHFFTLENCKLIVEKLIEVSTNGTIIYVVNHSVNHPNNHPENPKNNDYFKHFFSEQDLELLFKNELFERLFFADIKRRRSSHDIFLVEKWINKICDLKGVYDLSRRKEYVKIQLGDNREAALHGVFRFK